jgi:hypothetical protein
MNVGTLGSRAADAPPAAIAVGTRIRVERDESKYPSRGTWGQFRGKLGTVVEVNLGEYGVSFGKVTPRKSRPGSFDWNSADVAWFQPYELSAVSRRGSVAPLSGDRSTTAIGSTGKVIRPHSDRTLEAKELIHVQV